MQNVISVDRRTRLDISSQDTVRTLVVYFEDGRSTRMQATALTNAAEFCEAVARKCGIAEADSRHYALFVCDKTDGTHSLSPITRMLHLGTPETMNRQLQDGERVCVWAVVCASNDVLQLRYKRIKQDTEEHAV